MENIIRVRRLRWTGHVMRMDEEATTREAVMWTPTFGRRKPGRPRIDWIQTVKQDMKRGGGGASWEQLPELAADRKTWKELTALCTNGAGGPK
jgi:hypothetical protein